MAPQVTQAIIVSANLVIADVGALLLPAITRGLIACFADHLETDATLLTKLNDLTERKMEVLLAIATSQQPGSLGYIEHRFSHC